MCCDSFAKHFFNLEPFGKFRFFIACQQKRTHPFKQLSCGCVGDSRPEDCVEGRSRRPSGRRIFALEHETAAFVRFIFCYRQRAVAGRIWTAVRRFPMNLENDRFIASFALPKANDDVVS